MTVDERQDSLVTFKAFAIAEGIVLIVLGVLALIFPVVAASWTTGLIAVLFLVGGIVGWISNLARSSRMARWFCFWQRVSWVSVLDWRTQNALGLAGQLPMG